MDRGLWFVAWAVSCQQRPRWSATATFAGRGAVVEGAGTAVCARSEEAPTSRQEGSGPGVSPNDRKRPKAATEKEKERKQQQPGLWALWETRRVFQAACGQPAGLSKATVGRLWAGVCAKRRARQRQPVHKLSTGAGSCGSVHGPSHAVGPASAVAVTAGTCVWADGVGAGLWCSIR